MKDTDLALKRIGPCPECKGDPKCKRCGGSGMVGSMQYMEKPTGPPGTQLSDKVDPGLHRKPGKAEGAD